MKKTLLARRALRVLAAAACALLLGWGAFLLARPRLEDRVRERLERGARGLGLTALVGDVRLGPGPTLALRDVVLERPRLRVRVEAVDVRPRLSFWGLLGRAGRVSLSAVVLEVPAGVRIELVPSTWDVEWGRPGRDARPPLLRGGRGEAASRPRRGRIALRARPRARPGVPRRRPRNPRR
jgi:hypothetical protein